MGVFISMGLAVLIWSLYPLAAVKGLETMSGFELVAVASFLSAISITVLTLIHFVREKNISIIYQHPKNLGRRSYIAIIGSGVTHLLCHGLFFVALSLSHKGGVSLVYESWPIIAVIATPFLIKKRWKQVSLNEILAGLAALIGVIFIILSNEKIELPFATTKDLSAKTDYTSLFGYILAFVGAYACAMNVIFKGMVTQKFEEVTDTAEAIIISEFYSRLIGFALILMIYPFFFNYFDFSSINWEASIFIGIIVIVVGGGLYTYALIKTERPTIHIMYYFVPIIAVFWLWIAGETTINSGLFIGGAIIVLSNLYLFYAGRKAKLSTAL